MFELTPIEERNGIYFKRDDLFSVADVFGGKARTCWHLAHGANGLITAGSRMSPQIKLVAYIAHKLGVPCRAHCPLGELGNTLLEAKNKGCEIVQHKAGYNNVIIARAKEDAKQHPDWTYIPFGMECQEAIKQTSLQVQNIPLNVKRIVIPIGSGMSCSGLLWGLRKYKINIPVMGVIVGATPYKRIGAYAPIGWDWMLRCVVSKLNYHDCAEQTEFCGINLDPIYEAKCIPYIEKGDLLWIVGHR